MKRIITLAKKLIPAYIEVRYLYWVEYEKAMDEAKQLVDFLNVELEQDSEDEY